MNRARVRIRTPYARTTRSSTQVNASRPHSAFNIPTTVVDPGPDGVYGNGDDRSAAAFNLSDTTTPANNTTRNIDGYEGTFKTLELSANKHYSNRKKRRATEEPYSSVFSIPRGSCRFRRSSHH